MINIKLLNESKFSLVINVCVNQTSAEELCLVPLIKGLDGISCHVQGELVCFDPIGRHARMDATVIINKSLISENNLNIIKAYIIQNMEQKMEKYAEKRRQAEEEANRILQNVQKLEEAFIYEDVKKRWGSIDIDCIKGFNRKQILDSSDL